MSNYNRKIRREKEEEIMGIMDKMMGKRTSVPEPPKIKKPEDYDVEFVEPIGNVRVQGKDSPQQQQQPENPTVPLLAKYDEGQVMIIQLLQEILNQEQKLYEFFVEQSKR